uniref:Uncharacterized protein n=1 Tax=Meloidogyne enterolobii TaxID=390850 RepID=A0A6V7WN33_MELEN|nr:unnamed protein product [Meloidogyne enterolobii]
MVDALASGIGTDITNLEKALPSQDQPWQKACLPVACTSQLYKEDLENA